MSWRILFVLASLLVNSECTTTSLPTSTSAPIDKCDPDCSSGEPKVPDPLDCRQFYACAINGPIGPLPCPDGQYFNVTVKDCIVNGPVECRPICGGGGGGKCTYSCENGGMIADRFDCSVYYECDARDTLHTCNEDLPFFDGEKCQADERKCCHCKPYCYTGDAGKYVSDPLDCTKYYVCLEDFTVPEISVKCSIGNFDPFHRECSPSAPCLTMCVNVINSEGCYDPYTCIEKGYFPACPEKCDPRYYQCTSDNLNAIATVGTCDYDYVYHPDTGTCVEPSHCPYPPAGL